MIKQDKIQTSLQNCVDDSLYSLKNANTLQTLKPGHLLENCPIITFSTNKRFSMFLQINLRFNYATVENYKTINWVLRKQPSNKIMYAIVLENLLFSKNFVSRQSQRGTAVLMHRKRQDLKSESSSLKNKNLHPLFFMQMTIYVFLIQRFVYSGKCT